MDLYTKKMKKAGRVFAGTILFFILIIVFCLVIMPIIDQRTVTERADICIVYDKSDMYEDIVYLSCKNGDYVHESEQLYETTKVGQTYKMKITSYKYSDIRISVISKI